MISLYLITDCSVSDNRGSKEKKGVGWKCGVELQLLITNATDSDYSEERKSQGISFL